ncbi:hypothetical protein ACIQKE_17175 [Streptomyces griseoviridis]|uniref:Uncharacterized protein n=2 Tax=Streptomyces TaxID=1883 RepID=A0A3Q9KW37_STRGD|nr:MULTISPECIES: hypothetical protein [Streptomyces]AZS85528.1 hypothetical protein ELQ87_15370 [Streptomyces griseoviridis]MDT0473368.1 hypothetical protein [Streptomyces sp. DSM 41014]QCN87625.1 hypothetical protein DDJ31_23925 [Streptomyces griseoviridis]
MSDEYDTDLAFGSSSPSGSDDAPFRGLVGDILFETDWHPEKMRKIAQGIAGLRAASPEFAAACEEAGPLAVHFHIQAGDPLYWDGTNGTVYMNPEARQNRDASSSRLTGGVAFEILNAASESRRLEWETFAASGGIEQMSAEERQGLTPTKFFAYQMERIEFDNTARHRKIMSEADFKRSSANIYADAPRDFRTFWELQHQPRARGLQPHVTQYEFRYATLCPQPIVPQAGLVPTAAAQTSAADNSPLAQAVQDHSPGGGSGGRRRERTSSRRDGGHSRGSQATQRRRH